ncbi:uncharacterized protein F4812DRAFT_422576 [Daldinia caldariorum]|uniref:uncharacterized protein n=1 Tax=Daldinia caldariorum TaxID=326644 RepID=UPI002007D9A2|nr:uncharacterized protein F4812DRAFT_422576 [Daldinia caldariorum]KAI1469272.1 hypothetical protein F4812DRAFT_422576 [Daldinia caldariorum]
MRLLRHEIRRHRYLDGRSSKKAEKVIKNLITIPCPTYFLIYGTPTAASPLWLDFAIFTRSFVVCVTIQYITSRIQPLRHCRPVIYIVTFNLGTRLDMYLSQVPNYMVLSTSTSTLPLSTQSVYSVLYFFSIFSFVFM